MRVRAVPCAPLPEATAKPGDDLTRSRRLETRIALAKAGRVLSGGNVKMLADANAGDPLWAGRASVAFPTQGDIGARGSEISGSQAVQLPSSKSTTRGRLDQSSRLVPGFVD